jgi:hypothetical protein
VASRRSFRPYVHVFQLGRDARGSAVPLQLTTAPCYVYRAAHAARAHHLDAIAEPAIDEATGDVVLAAIEAAVERWGVLHELCTDAELDAERAPAHTNGFHAGATMEQAIAALARGGFVIHRVDDGGAAEPTEERALDDLVRHLDLASLPALRRSVAAREEELPFHASAARQIVLAARDRPGWEGFLQRATTRVAELDPELREVLEALLKLRT